MWTSRNSWILSLSWLISMTVAQRKVLLTSDNGWATAQIRAEYNALKAANYDVILDAPADDSASGTVSPVIDLPILNIHARLLPCQFNSCPPLIDLLGIPLGGYPVKGSEATDSRINFVTGHVSDGLDDGLNRLSPSLFGSPPNLVISGSHLGNTFGSAITTSETVGAAVAAIQAGIPAIAVSGATSAQVSFTTLQTDPNASTSLAAQTYTTALMRLVNVLTATLLPAPALPSGVGLNINFPPLSNCSSSNIPFILTRLRALPNQIDLFPCPLNLHIPDDVTTVNSGCFASVTIFEADTMADVDALTLTLVATKLSPVLTCPSLF